MPAKLGFIPCLPCWLCLPCWPIMFDLVIIGAGPAGLSAAIHAKRLGLNFTIIERGTPGGQATVAWKIENFPGDLSISGAKLMDRFLSHVNELEIKIQRTEAESVSFKDGLYLVRTDQEDISSNALILATGLEPVRISRPDAHYYPDPNSLRHEGRTVLVIGGGDSAFDEAISFSAKAKKVTIAMRGAGPKATPGLVTEAIKRGIEIKCGLNENELAKLDADIIVACIGKRRDLNILDDPLQITNHKSQITAIQLAGDILHPNIRHIAVALGDGITAVETVYENNIKNGRS